MEVVKKLKATTLADNSTFGHDLLGQWGLSILLQIEDMGGREHTILLDTGADKKALLFNIDRLKIRLGKLEAIVLSHGHRDHTAATVELAGRSQRTVKVIAHPYVFKKRYVVTKSGKKVLGQVSKGEREKDIERIGAQLMFTRESYQIIPGVFTTGEIRRETSFERIPGKRFIYVDSQPRRDSLLDDQAVIVNVRGQGAWVFSGCAHSGIINTLRRVKHIAPSVSIYSIVGGLHLILRSEKEIKPVVNALKSYTPKLVSPCHCTGFRATGMIWEAFEKEFVLNFSGRTIMSWKTTRPNVI